MKTLKISLIGLITFIMISLMLTSCGKTEEKKSEAKNKDKAIVSFILGNATVTRGAEPKRAIKAGENLFTGDVIETADKAHLTLQIRQDIVILVSPNTKMTLTSLEDPQKKDFTLEKGEALSKLGKLAAGQSYRVKTPSMVVGVRGTEFMASYNGKISSVAVGTGVVEVTKTAGNEEVVLEKGQAVDISDKISKRANSKSEILKLGLLNKLQAFEGFETLPIERLDQIKEEIKNQLLDALKKLAALEGEKLPTLEELNAKYGRIDVITLYSGKVIQGVITARGEIMTVITPQGIVQINSKDVQGTDIKK